MSKYPRVDILAGIKRVPQLAGNQFRVVVNLGPTRDYWNDFVLQACVNYKSGGIHLAGVPGFPASRPHSAVSQSFDNDARKQ